MVHIIDRVELPPFHHIYELIVDCKQIVKLAIIKLAYILASFIDPVQPRTQEEGLQSLHIHKAAQRDDVHSVHNILQENEMAIRMTLPGSETGDVPLHTGMYLLLLLIKLQCSQNTFSSNQSFLLSSNAAVRSGNHNVVDLLLNYNHECALSRNYHGETPLHVAAEYGHLPSVMSICTNTVMSAYVLVRRSFINVILMITNLVYICANQSNS